MKRFILFSLISFALFSCGKEEIGPSEKVIAFNEEEPLVAYWVESGYEDDVRIYTRAQEFQADKGGFAFFANGDLIERANSGFCGTPPISYANFDGSWSLIADKQLLLEGTFWGGEKVSRMEIVSLDNSTLKVKYLFE